LQVLLPPVEACVHVECVGSQHSVALPRVTDGGDGLHVRRLAASVMNKQSRTDDKGWFSGFRVEGNSPST
jgi:hypothetical protein